jgi:hypothetical protein
MRSDDVDMATVDRRFNFSLFGDSVVYGSRLDQADTLRAQLQKHLAIGGRFAFWRTNVTLSHMKKNAAALISHVARSLRQ